jgi:predicted transcriptional regulator
MSRYRKTISEAMAEVNLNEVGYLQSRLNDTQIKNIKNLWKHKTKSDVTPAVKKMIANMDVPTQLAIKHAGINQLSDLVEGRMSDIDAMRKQGASAAKIAKELGIDVKTVKAILGESEGDSAQDMQDAQAKAKTDKIKETVETWEEAVKKKEKTDVAPDNDVPVETDKKEDKKEKSDDTEKLKADVEKKDDQINVLKQKIDLEKSKAVQKDTQKMVNPETGEPLLQVGIAYKHLKDKMKREKEKSENKVEESLKVEMPNGKAYAIGMSVAKKKYNDEPPLDKKTIKKGHEIGDKLSKMKEEVDLQEAGITPQMIATLKKEYEPFRNKKITAARAKQLMNILDKFKEADLQKLGKENIPFISSGSRSKLAVRNMKFTVKNIQFGEEMDEEMFEACWTGYKQVGLKDKGGKKVPNCVPESLEEMKKMTATFKTHDKMAKASTDLAKHGFTIDAKGLVMKIDGKGADLNKYAIDLKNYYGATVKAENAPAVADIDRLKKQGMKPKMKNEEHPARAVFEQIAGLKNKAEKSGMPYGILKKVYDRGMAAWRGGHRPGATQQQWAFARVNSFVTKSSGTWGGADKDLAKQVKGK